MSIFEILIYLMLVIHLVTLPKIFEKGGIKETWKGYIPVYNYIVWLKLIKKPWWWIFFGIVPLVNLVVMVAIHVETARLFSKFSPKDTVLSILLPWYYIPFLAFKEENKITGEPIEWEKKEYQAKRFLHDHITLFFIAPIVGHAVLLIFKVIGSKQRKGKGSMEYEWTNAIGFAVVAATIIRVFFFEAFTIPTGSMEKTMRIGDYLFVNKMKYGARAPMTPLSVPFVHNRIPGTFVKSYVTWIESDYHRLPGYSDMERGDIMVFNWPVGDSVILHDEVVAHDYYGFLRDQSLYRYLASSGKQCTPEVMKSFNAHVDQYIADTRQHLISGGDFIRPERDQKGNIYFTTMLEKTNGLQTLTLDKKENYVKRCVAIHGDTLEIKNGIIHIDGQAQPLPPESQFSYIVFFSPGIAGFSSQYADETFGTYQGLTSVTGGNYEKGQIAVLVDSVPTPIDVIVMTATPGTVDQIKNMPGVDSIVPQFEQKQPYYDLSYQYCPVFPNDPSFDWSRDNFGPLVIPAEGMTIELTDENWILYRRVIQAYEYNSSAIKKADGIYINGEKVTQYTFKQDYYWMMGDNRHGSVDSRYWGFVGEDHIVGTASFVWMSKHPEKGWFSGGLRWDRVFSFVE